MEPSKSTVNYFRKKKAEAETSSQGSEEELFKLRTDGSKMNPK